MAKIHVFPLLQRNIDAKNAAVFPIQQRKTPENRYFLRI
jgi:hypothetical protein